MDDVYTPLLRDRDREINEVVDGVIEITRDLATCIYRQAPMLDHIESHIAIATHATSAGTAALAKASVTQNRTRSKYICLLLIVAVIILTILLATQLK